MVLRFWPREEKFFEYFANLCVLICEAVTIVKEFIQNPINPAEKLEKLADIEKNGQEIVNFTVKQLHSSFVTPFDREDILLLLMALNKILGLLHGMVKKHILYEVTARDIYGWGKITDILIKSEQEINKAVLMLRNTKQNSSEIIAVGDLLSSYKAEGDSLCRKATCRLFSNVDNAADIIRWKELYEHLEDTLEAFASVGNFLREIAVKYV